MLLSSLRWSRVVVDLGPDYVEQFRGARRSRWTVSIARRGALVVEPVNLIDGAPIDLPLRSIGSARTERAGRYTVAVITHGDDRTARIVCRDPAVAFRIAARCALLAGPSASDERSAPPRTARGNGGPSPRHPKDPPGVAQQAPAVAPQTSGVVPSSRPES